MKVLTIVLISSILFACNAVGEPIKLATLQVNPPAASQNIPTRAVNVLDFGAIPNDTNDDTLAIQTAIDIISSQGGGNVLFPAGRFDVSIQASSSSRPHLQAIVLHSKLRLTPQDSSQTTTIRLADKQGNYESMFGTAEYGTLLEDFILEGITIDGNGQNNLVNQPEITNPCCANSPDFGNDTNSTPRYALRSYIGHRVLVKNVKLGSLQYSEIIIR